MSSGFMNRYRMLLISVACGIGVCVLDAVLDWLLFYEGTFIDLLIFDVPEHEVYIRSLIFAIFLIFGFYAHTQVRVRERLNAKLESTLADKDALLKEVHHRIKNNLGVILSLVEMQRENVEDASAEETLNQVRMRLDAIILIHKQIYSQQTFASLRLDTYLQNLSRGLIALYDNDSKQVDIIMELDPVEVSPREAVPCGLICSELLTNAYKHAHPNGASGTIYLRLKSMENGYRLQVCDDGVGFPENFTLGSSNRLGLQLVKSLARQLNGTLDLHNDTGACITMHIRQS